MRATDRAPETATAVIVPSVGSPTLGECLDAVGALDPPPAAVVLVFSGSSEPPHPPSGVRLVRSRTRLGFAAAVNLGITEVARDVGRIALLNDDALPPPGWLEVLGGLLADDPRIAAVQGTIADRSGELVDGRGIEFDSFGLPVQVDRGETTDEAGDGRRRVLAVSGTAAVFRREALEQAAVGPGYVFDPSFGSYHEDLDLGLRLARLEWTAGWTAGAICRHMGSSSGAGMRWRHPWWLLANRWRALAGNLTAAALILAAPRLIRGELRAVRTLSRNNPRAVPAAAAVLLALPVLALSGWRRRTPGGRLDGIPAS